MGTGMGEAVKMKILILIFPLAGMGLPSASPSAARITMKSPRVEEKSFVITTWNCSLRRPGTRLTKSPMNHICQTRFAVDRNKPLTSVTCSYVLSSVDPILDLGQI